MSRKQNIKSAAILATGLAVGIGVGSIMFSPREPRSEIPELVAQEVFAEENIPRLESLIEREQDFVEAQASPIPKPAMPPEVGLALFETDLKEPLKDVLGLERLEGYHYAKPGEDELFQQLYVSDIFTGQLMSCFGFGLGLAFFGAGLHLRRQGYTWAVATAGALMTGVCGPMMHYNFTNEVPANSYFRPSQTITYTYDFTFDTPEEMAVVLAHEMTHFTQDHLEARVPDTVNDIRTARILFEGHANGAMKHVANRAYLKTLDPDYLGVHKSLIIPQLLGVYEESCARNAVLPRKDLFAQYRTAPIEIHSLGTALFWLAEEEHGPSIYEDFLEDSFAPFEDLLSGNK